ncbi:MAG: phosphatidylglycerophosphatase A [Holosporales bacterium]|jgi:phosphatidylglycerophosphatase A|nr:phosphatidylglycerophosphatase A [Holosporales bacterium]
MTSPFEREETMIFGTLWKKIAWGIATCGGIGLTPKIPGTCGALLAVLSWNAGLSSLSALQKGGLILGTSLLGGLAVMRFLRDTPQKDPPCVVIDELVGQWTALACVPPSAEAVGGAFLLFRLLDIWKRGGVRWIDAFSKRADLSPPLAATCIIGDDLLAGLEAGLCMLILLSL